MSDRRLLVSDADIDIARLLVKLDRLDGRESDPATMRIAQAAAFDEDADEDAEYEVADDVSTETAEASDVVEVGPSAASGATGSRYVLRRRPWVRVRPEPAGPGLPAF